MSDITPINSEEVEKEEEIEPEYVAGLAISLLREGQGLKIEVIGNSNYARSATPEDMLMIINSAHTHFNAQIAAGYTGKAIENVMVNKKILANIGKRVN